MSVREKYRLSAIAEEIETFEKLIEARKFDDALEFWRGNLEKPTLFGLETSLKRAALLEKINIEKIWKDSDKVFVLYSLALTLNLTGGYPNRAVTLYERHREICEKSGDFRSLSASLGHHAKALRQIGRFQEAEQTAFYGLQLIREQKDFLREAVNLYWLGMGLAHRGESQKSEIALQRSLRIFKANAEIQPEGVVNAFLAQRALWLGYYDEALSCAARAEEIAKSLVNNDKHEDLHGAMKVYIAGLRMKGESLVFLRIYENGEKFLREALQRAREIEFTEETLPALRALAMLERERENYEEAREYLRQSWELGNRGNFVLYNADTMNILATIEAAQGNAENAKIMAEKAFNLSICDGEPYTYRRGILDAREILNGLRVNAPVVPACQPGKFSPVTQFEINPQDEFFG